ncbi:class I SAM-dependent methyltransferase [Limnoraphis robusta]|uniref:class I SAM-dependent methyltransferase n=1 Tax=Limnoraphis robusta TaxID=1118279 RepID=UPI002B1F4EB5|nr:class I SAM-dependent methyltransferase [Limnoraphis robusta]MEA5497924.1 class I SAM-dependent methyltransferase [Limnoraphis robusta BA-68 BA1]
MDIERGEKRWRIFIHKAKKYVNSIGKCLDLGCGRGEFVLAGLRKGYDVFGIDVQELGIKQFEQVAHKYVTQDKANSRCILYDGSYVPFDSNTFMLVHSWFVLEHISNLAEVLREIVRVTHIGGILILDAQDARTYYEGHANIPWLPFMPKYLIPAWLKEFACEDKLDYLMNSVYYITTPEVVAILEACGCEILEMSGTPNSVLPTHTSICSEDEVIRIANEFKNSYSDTISMLFQNKNLHIIARKVL